MTHSEQKKKKQMTLGADAGIELEFILDETAIRSRVLVLSDDEIVVAYPEAAPELPPGQWIANVVVHYRGTGSIQLRVLIVGDTRTDDEGRRLLHLSATDERARAGLWLIMDWIIFGDFGPGSDTDVSRHRVRPIPQRGIYTEKARVERLDYVRRKVERPLNSLQHTFLRPESLSGNIENLIGSVEVPVGIAGPLLFKGEKAQGLLYAPLATTEGALVSSATRGAIAVTKAGGVTTRVARRHIMRVPLFLFADMRGAYRFSNWVRDHVEDLRAQTLRVSRHANLLKVEPELRGKMVTVAFLYETGDAAGQNMSTSCTWHACQWLLQQMKYLDEIRLESFFIESGISGDKKVSFQSFISGRGNRVLAECVLPGPVVEEVLKVSPEELVRGYEIASAFSVQAGTVGFNINVANIMAAVFTATGQDIACVHESSLALLYLGLADGGVYASLVLPSLVIGTVGGGTHLPRQKELLEMLGCAGPEKVSRLAEVIAGFCLALDLSTLAAIAGGQFAAAHERLGRNRPVQWFTRNDLVPSFFEAGVRNVLADESVAVTTVHVEETKDTGSSIITELTATKIEKLIGLIPVRLELTRSDERPPRQLDVMVKVKPLDDEVILMTHRLASMCGSRVANSHARFKDWLGFKGSHLRELEVYEQTDSRFLRHVPLVYRTYRNNDREAFVVVLENISRLDLMDSANDPSGWTERHLEAAIRGIASIHAIWFGRGEELRRKLPLNRVLTTQDMVEMRELWEDLGTHAATEFPDWFLDSDLLLRHKLIETLAEWWPQMESVPRTLIHNDFNPRNVAFRRDEHGPRLVAYDWELATLGVPQHDLAELLCYVLSPASTPQEVDRWVALHREALSKETSMDIPAGQWREGFRCSLYDLAINRMAFTIAAHTFRHFPFMERVHATLRRLIELESAQ